MTTTFPYPRILQNSLFRQLADFGWMPPDDGALLVEIDGRVLPFGEHVDHQRRTLKLAVWPGWTHYFPLIAAFAMLLGYIAPKTIAVTFDTSGIYRLFVGESRTARAQTRCQFDMREMLRQALDQI